MVGIAHYGHLTQDINKWLAVFRTEIDVIVPKKIGGFLH